MLLNGIDIPKDLIASFCQRNGIRRLSLFGSILRDDFSQASDIDLLVEFESGRVPGFLGMAHLEIELGKLLGRKIDLRTPAELSRSFREEIIREAVPQYVAA